MAMMMRIVQACECDISVFYTVPPVAMAPLNMGGTLQQQQSGVFVRFYSGALSLPFNPLHYLKHCIRGWFALACVVFSGGCQCQCIGRASQPVVSLGDRDPREWVNCPYPSPHTHPSSPSSAFLSFYPAAKKLPTVELGVWRLVWLRVREKSEMLGWKARDCNCNRCSLTAVFKCTAVHWVSVHSGRVSVSR